MINEEYDFIKWMQKHSQSYPSWMDIDATAVNQEGKYGLEVKIYASVDDKAIQKPLSSPEYMDLKQYAQDLEIDDKVNYTLRFVLRESSLDLIVLKPNTDVNSELDEETIYSRSLNLAESSIKDTLDSALLGYAQKVYDAVSKNPGALRTTLSPTNMKF